MNGIDPKTIKIGRKLINDKAISDSFVDYVRKALGKLDLFKDQVIVKQQNILYKFNF